MRLVLLFYFLLYSIFAHCQSNEILAWTEDYKLTWDDFKGAPGSNKYEAASALVMSYAVCKRSIWNGKVSLKVDCAFDKNASWVSVQKTDLLLRHEQLHFDIAELFARRLRKEFAINKLNVDNVDFKAKSLSDKVFMEYKNFSSFYDIDTAHGTIVEKQSAWEQKIKKELKALENFKDKEC
jgi:hypothetical protein